MKELKVFFGWDSREDIAYQVARASMIEQASIPIIEQPLRQDDLRERGLYWRDKDPLASTEFTYTRFLTPLLAGYDGWALFVDCDFLFFGDVAELEEYMRPDIAVACVQHDYQPLETSKMDGQKQTTYPRKNWSSFMLFNCAHPDCRDLSVSAVNGRSGAYLHRMQWTISGCIGAIPETWNWLEGWSKKPEDGYPKAVHYTSGGPWFENYQNVDYANEWRQQAARLGFMNAAA